jgi:hypothetical protein
LVDLFAQCASGTGHKLNLHSALDALVGSLDNSLDGAVTALAGLEAEATDALIHKDDALAQQVVDDALSAVTELAQQGAYLVDEDGQIMAAACPLGLLAAERVSYAETKTDGFARRPYFRRAKSLRVPFVSDSFPSLYNANLAIALCIPLFKAGIFKGMLFCAFHPGQSSLFQRLRSFSLPPETSLFVMDANGVLLIPPDGSLTTSPPAVVNVPGETSAGNEGHSYWILLQASRIDSRVKRLSENVVPLGQDDDLLRLSSDMLAYSLVAELKRTRWKVALCKNLGTST